MSDDDAKRTVLARRARFIAAAMAGIATASCDACSRPCLSAMPVTVDGSPMPCLSPTAIAMPSDAGEQTAIDHAGDAGDGAGDGGRDAGRRVVGPPPPPPHPCLSPPPRVCLEPMF